MKAVHKEHSNRLYNVQKLEYLEKEEVDGFGMPSADMVKSLCFGTRYDKSALYIGSELVKQVEEAQLNFGILLNAKEEEKKKELKLKVEHDRSNRISRATSTTG